MKKILVFVFMVFVLLFSVSAGQSLLRLSVGANIGYDKLAIVDESSASPIHLIKEGKITVGLEGRASIRYLLADFVGEISVIDMRHLYVSGILAAGPTVDIGRVLSCSLVVGPKIQYVIEDRGSAKGVDSEGEARTMAFSNALKEGLFNWRAMLDLIVGPVIRVGVAYTVPTGFSINQHNTKDIFPKLSSIADSAQTTFCIQMQLI